MLLALNCSPYFQSVKMPKKQANVRPPRRLHPFPIPRLPNRGCAKWIAPQATALRRKAIVIQLAKMCFDMSTAPERGSYLQLAAKRLAAYLG